MVEQHQFKLVGWCPQYKPNVGHYVGGGCRLDLRVLGSPANSLRFCWLRGLYSGTTSVVRGALLLNLKASQRVHVEFDAETGPLGECDLSIVDFQLILY